MQRVESCHLLVFLSVNQTENVQRGVQKAHFGDPPVLKKKGSPYLQESPDASTWSHVMLKIVELRTLLGKVGRDCCRGFQLCISAAKKRRCQAQRHAVQHSLDRRVKLRKKAICFTLLRRITNSKVSIQRSFQRVNL